MTHEKLEEKKAELQKRFDDLSTQKTQIEDEQKRLQGEHRLIQELLALEETSNITHVPVRIRKPKEQHATN